MNRKSNPGFTLVELMLAMAFLSALLLAIAMTVIQISNTYNRGTMLKDVNQSGRSISAELQRSIGESAPFTLGTNFINKSWGGRLCMSQYAYIWNYGSTLNSKNPLGKNKYAGNPSLPPINFVKVRDPGGSYCRYLDQASNPSQPTQLLDIDSSQSTELLFSSDHSLAIQKFSITSPNTTIDAKSGQQLYSVTFYIGTNDSQALISSGTDCKLPGVRGADIAHCSVQEFNIAIRAGNSVK